MGCTQGKSQANPEQKKAPEGNQDQNPEQNPPKQQPQQQINGIISNATKFDVFYTVHDNSQQTIHVGPNSTSRRRLIFPLTNKAKISILIDMGAKKLQLVKTMAILKESEIRICIWGEKEIKMTQVCKQPKVWRFTANCGEERNYPPGYLCPNCKNDLFCDEDCPEYELYGGITREQEQRSCHSVIHARERPDALKGRI